MSKKSNNGDFWADADDFVPPSEWFKFDNPGDKVTGTLAKLTRKTWDDSVAIEMHWKEKKLKPVSANQVLLKRALIQLRPNKGDGMTIEFLGEQKLSKGRAMKHFYVTVSRSGGEVDTVDTRDLTGSSPGF